MAKPTITPRLQRDGYEWLEVTPEEFGKMLARAKAKCYVLDVYASNNAVYRNIHIDIDGKEIESQWVI